VGLPIRAASYSPFSAAALHLHAARLQLSMNRRSSRLSLARINRPRAHGRTHTIEPFGVWIASTATRARAHEQHDDCLVWSLDSSRQSRAVVQVQVQSLLVLGTLCCDLGCYHLAHASCRSTAIVPFGLVKSFWGCQGVFRVLIRTRRTERKYWERCSFHTEKQNKLRVCLVRGVKV